MGNEKLLTDYKFKELVDEAYEKIIYAYRNGGEKAIYNKLYQAMTKAADWQSQIEEQEMKYIQISVRNCFENVMKNKLRRK